MESKLHICPRCRIAIKFISGLTRYINVYKKPVPALLYCQNPDQLLKYINNMSLALDKRLDNNEKDIK